MNRMSAEQWIGRLRDSFTKVARAELPGTVPDITWHTQSMTMRVPCGPDQHFDVGFRGEMFLMFYNDSYLYIDFVNLEPEEIEECLTEAVREIKRVADGSSMLVEVRSRFRKIPRFELTGAAGEVRHFTPSGEFIRKL